MNYTCECQNPQSKNSQFERNFLGIDEQKGRFGEVSIDTCKACQSKWIYYFVEYEAFSKSGRWFRALINSKDIDKITPLNAVDFFDENSFCIAGGSYYDSIGFILKEKPRFDL